MFTRTILDILLSVLLSWSSDVRPGEEKHHNISGGGEDGLTGPARAGRQLRVLGEVADISVVLLPVPQEGEHRVDQKEEDHGEDDDLLGTDAEL